MVKTEEADKKGMDAFMVDGITEEKNTNKKDYALGQEQIKISGEVDFMQNLMNFKLGKKLILGPQEVPISPFDGFAFSICANRMVACCISALDFCTLCILHMFCKFNQIICSGEIYHP